MSKIQTLPNSTPAPGDVIYVNRGAYKHYGVYAGEGTGGDVLGVMGQLFGAVREGQITKREITRYNAMRDVAITQILAQARIAEQLIDKTFKERRRVIEKSFEVIDAGMAQNDYTKINMGLQSITEIVKHNPFKLFSVTTPAQRHQMLEDGNFSLE